MGRRLINRQYKLGSRAPSMQTLTGDSGIANLSPYLTINSTTVAPTFVYHGNDATASTFPAQWGEALAIAGSGTGPLLNQPALGNGISDYAVVGNGGEYYKSSNTTWGNIGTGDLFWVCALKVPTDAGSSSVLARKYSGQGWSLFFDTSASFALTLFLNDGTGGSVGIVAPPVTSGQYMLFTGFVNRGEASTNGAALFSNAVAGSGVDPTLAQDAITSPSSMTMLATDTGTLPVSDGGVVYFAMYEQADWFSSGATGLGEAQAKSTELFQKWSGIYPTKASGTAAPTYSRDCSAYATKWNGTSYDLINCSAGLPRVDYVLDDSGTPFKGMLIEPQATNLLTYSEDSTQLTVIDAGDVLGAAAGIAPNNQSTMVSLVADTTDGQHGAAESNAPTLAAVSTTYSRYFIKGGNDHVWLENTTVANTQSWFNLDTGAVGTLGSGATSRISGPFYSDLGEVYRCEITFTGTVAAHTFNWGSSAVDNDETFAGDAAAINCYTWGAQVEAGTKATSYYYTAGASATRLADDLQYNGDNVTAGQGTFKAELLVDTHTPAAELSIAALSDGGSADEMVRSYVDAGTQVPIFNAVDSTVAQWTITGSTDVVDGDIHSVRLPYETNDAKQYVDTALDGTPDTSCTVPTGIDEIDIGQDTSSANQLNGRIRNVAIYSFASSDV